MCVKNVGRMDAYVRISAGLMMVSLGIMKHKGWMAALGSMKVAEGITRYCPVLDALNLSTLSDEELLDEALGSCVIDIEEDDDDEFEKILRHAVTLPVNDKIKNILEHFIEDDETYIVCLARELLQNYDK